MRHIPWILVGLFAIDTGCGGKGDAPSSVRAESTPGNGSKVDPNDDEQGDEGVRDDDDVASDDDALTCDAGEDASACMVCFHDECCAQIARCEADARCGALLVCRAACKAGDDACRTDCEDQHPRGVATLRAAEQCMINDCRSACER